MCSSDLFEAVLVALAKAGYGRWVTIELYPCIDNPDDSARRARAHVLPILERVESRAGA